MRLISARTTCSQKKLQSTPACLGHPLSIPRLADHREPHCSSKGTIARQRHNRIQRASQSLPVTPSHAHFAITRTTADTPTHHALALALGAHRAASSLLSQSRRPPIQVRPSYGDCTPTRTHTTTTIRHKIIPPSLAHNPAGSHPHHRLISSTPARVATAAVPKTLVYSTPTCS